MNATPPACKNLSRRAVLIGVAGLVAGCNDAAATALPVVSLPPIKGLRLNSGWDLPGVETRAFAGRVTVLNVWASWCGYCRAEHALLKQLAGDPRYVLVGIVHNDNEDSARAYLRQAGNPFAAASVDDRQALTRPLGQRGVPATYVIGRDLKVVAKIPGQLSDASVNAILRPAVDRARMAPAVG